jgi:hypothetical protein
MIPTPCFHACLQGAYDALIRTEVAQDLLTGDFRLDGEQIANGDNVALLDDGELPGEDFARLLMVFSGRGVHVQLQRDTGADLSPRGEHFTAIHRAGGLIHQGRENRIGVVSIEADEQALSLAAWWMRLALPRKDNPLNRVEVALYPSST